jgi:hypothetical protein
MSFPKMPPVNYIRQLRMFNDYVPRRARFWTIVVFALFYQCVGGVYLASLPQMMGDTGWLSEDVNMANYCALIGLNIIFPILFRWKFGLFTRQLFFIASGVIIACSVGAVFVTSPVALWGICLVAGYFKMLGMFGCISTIQLNFTPTRSFPVFLPIIYLLVLGGMLISGTISTYVTYYFNWRAMNLVIMVMMVAIEAVTYFFMKHDHRSGPPIPLKGIDWLGQTLWIAVCVVGAWVFTFGEHYDWWSSPKICRGSCLFIIILAATIIYSHYKKEPFIPLRAFCYPKAWMMMLLLMGTAIIQGGAHLLHPTLFGGVLNYDSLNQASFNIPELFGVIMGAILAYFILVRWKWTVKRYLFLTFFFLTYYALSMFYMCDTATDKETMYLAIFAFGLAEVLMENIATYYLSQNIPFQHFFMNITIIGFVRCGLGSSAAGAIAHRIFNRSLAKNYLIASESIDMNSVSDQAMQFYNTHSLLMAMKETYGIFVFLGVALLLIVLVSNFRGGIKQFVPRLVAVARWMTRKNAPDPMAQ